MRPLDIDVLDGERPLGAELLIEHSIVVSR